MKLYCTYCSAEKRTCSTPLPALQLYKSTRIKEVHAKAQEDNCSFAILSGKYGIVLPNTLIPFYDHLLQENEVKEHAKQVATQIKNIGATHVVFYMNYLKNEPQLAPYLNCIKKACSSSGIELEIIEDNYCD